jgi:hypothetical protein
VDVCANRDPHFTDEDTGKEVDQVVAEGPETAEEPRVTSVP